tara:strand:+ start:64 stop:294 length:231 start_codon:yes stop_codon:yes gene_type:complete
MNEKGFEAEITLDETPNFEVPEEKPLKSSNNQLKKVDINVLKARAQETQNKENRKNIFIFISLLIIIGVLGVYLSI